MAQLVETMSVFAADRRLKEPRLIPRPGTETPARVEESKQQAAATHGGLLTAASMRGKVVVVQAEVST